MKRKSNNYFLTGVISLIPLVLTLYIMLQLFKFFLGFIGSLIPMEYITEKINSFFLLERDAIIISKVLTFSMTFLLLYLTVFLIGFLVKHILNVEKTKYIETVFLKIPFIKPVYGTIKQIVEMIRLNSKNSDKSVVIVEYPKAGIYTVGFMTNTKLGKLNDYIPEKEMVNILIPMALNPISGIYIMVSKAEIIETDIKVEEALKLIVSGGAIVPQKENKIK